MKIVRVELIPVGVSRHTGFVSQHVIVLLHTDEGLTGIGEMSDMSHLPRFMPDIADLEEVLTSLLQGVDPLQIGPAMAIVNGSFPEANFYYDKGSFIRNGVDLALHDLAARALGQPVWQLLGGRYRDRIKVCYPIFRHRSVDEVPENLARVEDCAARGFDVIRLYVGANAEADETFLDAFSSRFRGRVHLKSLDFSHLLDWKASLSLYRRLRKYDFELVESPALANDIEGLRTFRAAVDHPVSEHVWSFRHLYEMIRQDAVDIVNITPIFIGGLERAKTAFGVAKVARKGCLIGTTQELGIGTVASAHLGAAVENLTHISDPTGPCLYTSDVVNPEVRFENGYLYLPGTGTGFGVDLDPDRVRDLHTKLGWADASSLPPERIWDRSVGQSISTPKEG